MKVVVTGAGGQVGRSLHKVAAEFPELELTYYTSKQLDITDKQEVLDMADTVCPDYIINCAAYTAVDKAESEPERAQLINTTAAEYLAEAALGVGATLVHYSSDYVYHNKKRNPLRESDPTTPQGIYARTKLAGEDAILRVGCKSMIIRTSWVYSEYGTNFVKTMLKLAETKQQLSIVHDQVGCPTYATDIARATLQMVGQYPYIIDRQVLVNYAGAGAISWFEFAVEIFKLKGIDMVLAPIPTADYPTDAPRPLWSVLDMSHIEGLFDIKPIAWQEGLEKCLAQLDRAHTV